MKAISELRRKLGLTQAELAERVGVGVNSIARYERGEMEPSLKIAHAIAEALGCTEAELLNGPNENKIKISLSYDWEKYEKGEINMTGNEFDLFLGRDGEIGLKGAAKILTREALQDFISRITLQAEAGFEAQIKRGVVQPA